MKVKKIMMLTLPFLLGGCLTESLYKSDRVAQQPRPRAQIEQTQIQMQQKQKITQKNTSQTINVNQQYYPYPIYSEAQRRADERAGVIQQPAGRRAQRAEYYRHREELNRQANEASAREARQMAQARQNSMVTAAQEQARRQELAAQEARDMEQAKQNSLRTYAQEQARRQEEQNGIARENERQREEAGLLEQARQESLRTHAQEEAKRQQAMDTQSHGVVSSSPVTAVDTWEPNSGHLVRAGDLVMELKRDNGGNVPSHGAMVNHIQSKMALTPAQAELVLQELGL